MAETFVLAWNQNDDAGSERADAVAAVIRSIHPAVRGVITRPGLSVLTEEPGWQRVRGSAGEAAILGQYHGDLHSGCITEARTPTRMAEALTKRGWGSYTAVIETKVGTAVLRDPSGSMPLHRAGSRHLTIAATQLTPALLTAGGIARETRIGAVAEILARPPEATHLLLLAGVTTVQPGCLVMVPGADDPVPVWSPVPSAMTYRRADPEEIVATLDAIVASMAGADRIGVELSGGFDSSAVLASLVATGRKAHAFNVATAGEGGNEAQFASAMAKRAGVPLTEYRAGEALPDYRPLASAQHPPQPFLAGLDSVFASARQDAVDQHRLGAVMTGQGGDAVFFRLPTRLVAADRLRAHGPRALWGRPLVEDAIRAQSTVWGVLAAAIGLDRSERGRLPALTPHLLGQVAAEHLRTPPPVHPWLADATDIPPAKRLHVMALIHAQLFNGRKLFGSSARVLHPLLAQPMIELTLACPTFALAQGPLDRGLARMAMRGRLAESVMNRRSKGEASDHYAKAVLANRRWLLETLLDGHLARERLIDRKAVEAALLPESVHISSDYRAMLVYASVETWMRHWS